MAGSCWETGESSDWEIKYRIREFCLLWWLCYRAAWLIQVEHATATYYTGCMCTKRAVVTCTCPSQGSNGCISLWICNRSFLTILMSFTGFAGNMAVVQYKYSINLRWISTGVRFPMWHNYRMLIASILLGKPVYYPNEYCPRSNWMIWHRSFFLRVSQCADVTCSYMFMRALFTEQLIQLWNSRQPEEQTKSDLKNSSEIVLGHSNRKP